MTDLLTTLTDLGWALKTIGSSARTTYNGWHCDEWHVVLSHEGDPIVVDPKGYEIEIKFHKGLGYKGEAPTLDEVLHSLLMDSTTDDFDTWASGLGYSTDSRAAYKIWEQCCATGAALRVAIGVDGLDHLGDIFQDY